MSTTLLRHVTLCAGIVLYIVAAPAMAQVLEPEALQRKQEDQQRARTMTRDLLGGVLDVQLRQLEENGLSNQEIYRDIKLMRQNLNHLVETEMSKVVDLLVEAQKLPKEKREAVFVEARQQIRNVVRQLAIERQNLLKRLKIAELAEQVRRLIRHETVVQTATKGLPAEPRARQEALTLKAIEDQRDVKELFLHLVDTMVDMKSWSGMLAMAAADGLRILKAADVGKHLDGAGRQLQAVKYEAAYDEQEHVIKGLKELLRVIERAQGTLNSEKMASIDRLRALVDKQKQLRDETKKLAENQQPPAELVEQQSQIQKEIAQLQDSIRDNPKADTHIQQAETAALDAAANLLDDKSEQAIADQGRVLGNLAALEIALKEQAKQQTGNKSANELAEAAKALTETKTALVEAQKKQDAAEKKAEQNAQSAAPEAKAAAEIVQQAMDKFDLPASVESALADATAAEKEAAKNLETAVPEKATAVEEKALAKAGDALDRAMATVDAAIADAERQESAVKIGELARAAEVLERAAAEERAIAKDAAELARSDEAQKPKMAEMAKDLADRQADIKAIAEKAAEALAQTAPAASKDAAAGAKSADESGTELKAVADEKAADPKAAAMQAAGAATASAQKLADAAKEIRKEIISTAKELASKAAAQAEKLAEARTAVEKAVDLIPSNDKVAQLEAAKDQLDTALQEQAKAQGKPEAAAAMELVKQIGNALDAQDAATTAAVASETGNGSELKATTKQEEVAEKSQAAAESAAKRPQAETAKSEGKPDALAQALGDAQQAAAQAAKQTLDGNQPAAEASRKATEAALKNAMELAKVESAAANKAAPTGKPDKQAQTKAAESAAAAQAMAAKATPDAGADVAPAAAATEAADRALAGGSDQAPAAQSKAAAALQDAGQKLDAAIQKAATEQAKALAQQAKDNSALADQVAKVDPAAADAVDVAADSAKAGSEAHGSPQQMAAAANTAELALEHAAADLGAKEQEVRRDKAIAESIADLAKDQQTAADVIADQAANLEKMAAVPGQGDAPMATQQSAAQKLSDAQQQFADTQRATGQGAVELSGQTEVANPPLREALEMASNLPTTDLPSAMLPESALANGEVAPSADGHPLAEGQPVPADPPANGDSPAAAEGSGAPAAGRAAQGTPATGKPNGLGTGFVPQSPQLTAEMMAGAKAQKAAQQALAQQLPMSQNPSQNQALPPSQTSDAQEGQLLPGEHANSSKLTRKDGAATKNQKVKDGAIEKQPEGTDATGKMSTKMREKEESILAKQLKDEAWFAKLPPELRKSIRAGAGQKPPRAYEERLKKYFQSVD